MIGIFRVKLKRLIFAVILIVAFSAVTAMYASATSVSLLSAALDPNDLTDGVYNIINCETGKYLDVYDTPYDKSGRSYVDNKSGESGQNFIVKRQDDGTYLLCPQSEDGAYYLCYQPDIMESELVTKSKSITTLSRFTIEPNLNEEKTPESYTIKPTGMNDEMLALGISNQKGPFEFSLVNLSYNTESPLQQWKFVKVTSESLRILGGYINVRMGYTQDIYAKITPDYLIGNLIWETSDPTVATVDEKGLVTGISEGVCTITVTCGQQKSSTEIKVTDLPAYTWYSQHNTSTGGWDAVPLNGIYFHTYYGRRKLFFMDGYNGTADWMDMGCKLCSEAMILHNMGATLTEGYDLRSGETNNLPADPYTVALANAGTSGYNVSSTVVINNPVLVNHYLINPRFKVNGKTITTQEWYGNSLAHIKELLESHPEGVVVGMRNVAQDSTHYVVFTECLNPDDPYGNYEFRICDSAAYDPALGDNVPFKESISYLNLGYNYWSIFEYSVYHIEEEQK